MPGGGMPGGGMPGGGMPSTYVCVRTYILIMPQLFDPVLKVVFS